MQSRLQLPDGPLAADTLDNATGLFTTHGALWIENAFPREFIDELRKAYAERYISLGKAKLRKKHAVVGDGRFMITLSIEAPFDNVALYANERLLPVLQRLLGAGCVISSFGSVVAFAGADAQSVHFDYPPLFESEQTCAALPPHAITMVVPLIDLDESTGTTAIWEGTHTKVGAREQLQQLAADESLAGAVMPYAAAGDVYLMDYRLIHAGTPNTSETERPILYIVYSRPWFREDMNFTEQPAINITKQQLKTIPKSHRHLFALAQT